MACPKDCGANGKCMFGSDNSTQSCRCRNTHRGDLCQYACPFELGVCAGNGKCVLEGEQTKCICASPVYRGAACELECPGSDLETGRVCSSRGSCNAGGDCDCYPGWQGANCDEAAETPTAAPVDGGGGGDGQTEAPTPRRNKDDANYELVEPLPPAPKIPSNAYQRIQMVWGIESFTGEVLSTSASIGIGLFESSAEAKWDPTFDLLEPESQLHLDYIWTRLLNSTLIMPEIQLMQNSFIARWKQFALMRTGAFPVPKQRAKALIMDFMEYPAYKNEQYMVGFHDDGTPKWVGFTLIGAFDSDLGAAGLEPYYQNWEHFMRQLNLDGPGTMNKGFQTAPCWVRMR
jgi:hypothetical protein